MFLIVEAAKPWQQAAQRAHPPRPTARQDWLGPLPPHPWRGPPLLDPCGERSPGGKRQGTPTLLDPRRGRTEHAADLLNPGGALSLLDPCGERIPGGKRPGTPSFLVPRRGRTERVLTPLDPDGALPLLDQGERHGTPSFLVRRIKRCELWI